MTTFTSIFPMVVNNMSTMRDISAQNIDLSENLVVSGNGTISGSSDVSGDVVMDGTLDMLREVSIGSDLYVSGDTVVDGTLDVSGIVTLGSDLDVSGNVTIDGTLDVSGIVNLGSDLDVSGNVTMDGTLDVSGDVTMDSDLDVSGDVTIDGTLGVIGDVTMDSDLDVVGDVNMGGDLDVSGDFAITRVGYLKYYNILERGYLRNLDIDYRYNNWTSVTWGNGLFVAVASSGSIRVMTTPDGINWTGRSAAATNVWTSVTWGYGLFVAVASSGTGNRVMTSPDGINWESQTSASDNDWRSVTWGNGLFVAVASSGTGNRVMTSPDGINWESRTSASDDPWLSIAWGNGVYVAVGSVSLSRQENGTGKIMTSYDGIVWTIVDSAPTNAWKGVTWGDGLFVAAGVTNDNRIKTSSDGITWNTIISASARYNTVAFGNGVYVVVSARDPNSGATKAFYTHGLNNLDFVNGTLDVSGNVTIDGTLDVSGIVNLGSDLDISGNVTMDGTLDVSGTTTLHDISCNGAFTIVGNDIEIPVGTIQKNDDGVIFDTIVIRRVSNNETINLRELQLWVDGVNILPGVITTSNNRANESLGNTTEYFNNNNNLTEISYVIGGINYIASRIAIGSLSSDFNTVSIDIQSASNSSLYIPMDISMNSNNIQSLVLYNRTNTGYTYRAIGLRLELYNRSDDPSLFNPLAFTNRITSDRIVYRFDFPAFDTYPDASFVTTESPNNITSNALIYTDITYNPSGLKIENAGLEVDGNILSKSLSVVDSESTDPIVAIRNIGAVFDTFVIRGSIIGLEFQCWVDNFNILPSSVSAHINEAGLPLGDSPSFFNPTTMETTTGGRLIDGLTNNNTFGSSTSSWETDGTNLYLPMNRTINIYDVQAIVYYTRRNRPESFVNRRIDFHNRKNDPSLSSPVISTGVTTASGIIYRFDFPSISSYNKDFNTGTNGSSAQISSNAVIETTLGPITGLKIENAGLEVNGQGKFNGNVQCVSLTQTSDDRLKKDEQYISNATQTITKLRPQTYNKYTSMDCKGGFTFESGLIAQEVYYDVPELRHLVHTDADISGHIYSSDDPTIDPDYSTWGSKPASFNYIGLIPYCIQAIKEQQGTIEKDYNDLSERIQSVESVVNVKFI